MTPEQQAKLASSLGLNEAADADAILEAVVKKASAETSGAKTDMVPKADYDLAMSRASKAEKTIKDQEAEAVQAQAEVLVNEATEAGKIAPSSREFWLNSCSSQGLEIVKAHFDDLVSQEITKPAEIKHGETGKTMTASDKSVADLLGISEEDWASERKKVEAA